MAGKITRDIVFTEVTGIKVQDNQVIEFNDIILGKNDIAKAQRKMRKVDDTVVVTSAIVKAQKMQMTIDDFITHATVVA